MEEAVETVSNEDASQYNMDVQRRREMRDSYLAAPKSSYLPKEDFFRLCRLCMTVMPLDDAVYKAHMKQHNRDERRLKSCKECSLMVSKKESKEHRNDHQRTKYQCVPCRRSFADDTVYYIHLVQAHSVDLIHFCKRCNIATKSVARLKTHINTNFCVNIENSRSSRKPLPGVIGESLFSFDGGLAPGGETDIVSKRSRDNIASMNCLVKPDCAKRGLIFYGNGKEERRKWWRVSCPTDFYPLPYHLYSSHDRKLSKKRFEQTLEQIKEYDESVIAVEYQCSGIMGIASIASYWTGGEDEEGTASDVVGEHAQPQEDDDDIVVINHDSTNAVGATSVVASIDDQPTPPSTLKDEDDDDDIVVINEVCTDEVDTTSTADSIKNIPSPNIPVPSNAEDELPDVIDDVDQDASHGLPIDRSPIPVDAAAASVASPVAPTETACATRDASPIAAAASPKAADAAESSAIDATPLDGGSTEDAVPSPTAAALPTSSETAAVSSQHSADVESTEAASNAPTPEPSRKRLASPPAAPTPPLKQSKLASEEEIKLMRTTAQLMGSKKIRLFTDNFCRRGDKFDYTAQQMRETRLDVEVKDRNFEPTKCLFCHSQKGLYRPPPNHKDEWIHSYVDSKNGISDFSHYARELEQNQKVRICARHFDPCEIHDDGRMDHAVARPKYMQRECLLCKEPIICGLEMPILYKDQVELLAAVPGGKITLSEMLHECGKAVQYACHVDVIIAANLVADALPTEIREQINRKSRSKSRTPSRSLKGDHRVLQPIGAAEEQLLQRKTLQSCTPPPQLQLEPTFDNTVEQPLVMSAHQLPHLRMQQQFCNQQQQANSLFTQVAPHPTYQQLEMQNYLYLRQPILQQLLSTNQQHQPMPQIPTSNGHFAHPGYFPVIQRVEQNKNLPSEIGGPAAPSATPPATAQSSTATGALLEPPAPADTPAAADTTSSTAPDAQMWTDVPSRHDFMCRLCVRSYKPATTPRVRPESNDVEEVMDSLRIDKHSFRRHILRGYWREDPRSVRICKEHVTSGMSAMETGEKCADCSQFYLLEERTLHSTHNNTNVRFCCRDCFIPLEGDEMRALRHMVHTHGLDIPTTFRLECPLKNTDFFCEYISTSIEEYSEHIEECHPFSLRYPISNKAPLFYPARLGRVIYTVELTTLKRCHHNCGLKFRTEEAQMCHNAQVIKEKTRFDRFGDDVDCCPLCGSINLWEGELDGVKVSHFTLHSLEWTTMCRLDLKEIPVGPGAEQHFLAHHNGEDADQHLLIGLSEPRGQTAVIRSSDNTRALLGIDKE